MEDEQIKDRIKEIIDLMENDKLDRMIEILENSEKIEGEE